MFQGRRGVQGGRLASSGLSFQSLHVLEWLFEILLYVMAWVVPSNNVFAFLYRTNGTHLVFIEETKELPCGGGLYERLVRRIFMGRDLEEGGNQLTVCSEERTLLTAAGSTRVQEEFGSRRGQARDLSLKGTFLTSLSLCPLSTSVCVSVCLCVFLCLFLPFSLFLSSLF